jgi:hypothetical protein
VTAVEQHSVRADRQVRQPMDIANLARQAAWDVDEGLDRDERERVIGGLKRLIAIGGLAKALADQMEAAGQPERVL